jgi:hypothetical protein
MEAQDLLLLISADVSRSKPVNPFYAVLVVAGVTFALTATLYGAMTVRKLDTLAAEPVGVMAFMEEHGLTLMLTELGALALLTFAAIGTDDYWMRDTNSKEEKEKVG